MVDKVYLGIIAVLVLIIIYLFVQSNQSLQDLNGQRNAANVVKDIYDLQYETNAEVLSTVEMDGVYKVTVRFTDFSGQKTTQDVFITKDGKLITDRFIIADNYKTALQKQKTFIECLLNKNLHILGQSNDTATLQQFNILGNYAYKLFVSCDASNEQACANLGVTRYPTTIYNNTAYPNIYAPAFFAQLTGCSLPQ